MEKGKQTFFLGLMVLFFLAVVPPSGTQKEKERERERERKKESTRHLISFFSSSFHFSFPNSLSEEFRLMATLLSYLLGTFIELFFPVLLKNF